MYSLNTGNLNSCVLNGIAYNADLSIGTDTVSLTNVEIIDCNFLKLFYTTA